jgi:DNA-binding MarR family transcriptional regulator
MLRVVSSGAKRALRIRDGAPAPRSELQRARKLVSAAEAVRRHPCAELSDAGTDGHAPVARASAEAHLARCEAAELAALDQVLAVAAERASVAYAGQEGWLDRVRAGLFALLHFSDEQPALSRFCVVGTAQAGPAVQARRCEVVDALARVLDDEHAPARGYPPPLTARAVVSGALSVVHARLSPPDPETLLELSNSLMSFIVLPFLGVHAARRELSRPVDATSLKGNPALDWLYQPRGRPNHNAISVLKVIASEPGLNNIEVALRASLNQDPGQVSRLLSRMARFGLIVNTLAAQPHGRKRAWQLTASGEQLEAAIGREAALAASTAVDVPEEFGGRMDYQAVCVLRVIAGQPWLTSREIRQCAALEDPARIPKVLTHLEGLGLVTSAREAHRKGTPKVWLLTAAGEKLEAAIGRDTPPPPRSLAVDLMWQSGGRLSDDAVSVLRVSAAEPGLSNNGIALQVGITNENTMSQLLARLVRRGLMENTRTQGRYNVWLLTPTGKELESAIRRETPAPLARATALDHFKKHGGRLNHRVVSVLRVIGTEPGLSNNEIAQRVGIEAKGHASTLLTRLARFGLIENLIRDPLPFAANAWQLTATGKELGATIGHEIPAPQPPLRPSPS